MKRTKKELGSLEMQLLAYAQMRKQDTLSLEKIAPILGITKNRYGNYSAA